MVLMALKNPFRPGGPVEPEYFIGRKDRYTILSDVALEALKEVTVHSLIAGTQK